MNSTFLVTGSATDSVTFTGSPSANWPETLIEQLKRIPASQFVAVDTSSLKVSSDSAATLPPS